MTNLQMLFIVVSITILIFSLMIYRKRKIWFLTFLFFFGGSLFVGILSLRVEWLNAIWITFGLNRGADLIVYISIMALFYLVLSLHNKYAQAMFKQTDLVRKLAISKAIWTLNSECVFVIPIYNESDACIDIVKQILGAGHSVVAVDDGSSNGIFKSLEKEFDGIENFVFVRHLSNLGQGAALQTGFDYILESASDARFVITFDADGQHRLEDLPNFLLPFKENPDLEVTLGSRFLGSTVNMPWSKRIVLKIWILFTFCFSGMWMSDTHNGYRAIKVSSLPKLRLTFNGMEHASELLELIGQQKMVYQEVPNTIVYTEYSMARGQKLSNSLRIVKNLILGRLFGL